jgi:very-short-patch-repair endonuclease
MPPTTFFNRGTGAGDEDTDEDLESILDECLAAGVPQHSLTWHYRSRHESLIAFSNHEYYHDSLVTFPAPDTRESAVSLRRVEGVYAPGSGGRRNQAEAKAIVDEVVKRLTDPAFIRSRQTIGIITLNAEQQQLIDDLLDQARRDHPAIEAFFKTDLTEPVIVKNLETMQGDERDLIMLGIGYGPTEPGAKTMSMNFGPLNRDGGWRRLNVAVTRARQEMLIFTSFDAPMIDLSRTSARAVQDLRHFVEFALQGPKAIAAAVHGSMGSYESPFEEFVADGLRQKGWETHPQIGVSRFRIDLGVVNPDCPGDYLVGIECDGATYHSAATARDRDKIRAEILRGLGWQLLRVWSTEWWVNSGGALDRLDLSITAELDAWRARTANAQHDSKVVPAGSQPKSTEPEAGDLIVDQISNVTAPSDIGATPGDDALSGADALRHIARQANSLDKSSTQRIYRKVDLTPFRSVLRPADFQEPTYDTTLDKLVHAVLEAEAPILDKALVDRIARAHGFRRSGRLIRDRILVLAKRRYHFQVDSAPEHGAFVWMSADDPGRWDVFRVPEREEDIRFIEEIPIEELAAAACIARGNDLPIEVARMFRVQRLSAPARARLERAAQSLRPVGLE